MTAHLNDRDRSISEAVVRVVAYARGLLSAVAKTRSTIAIIVKIDPSPNIMRVERHPCGHIDFRMIQGQLACKNLFRLLFKVIFNTI